MPPLLPPVSPQPFPYLPKSILIIFLAYAGSKPPQTLTSLCRALLGWSVPPDAYMTLRERLDFVIVTLLFGVLVGADFALSVLSAQWFVSTIFRPSVHPQFYNRPPLRNPWDIRTRSLDYWVQLCYFRASSRQSSLHHYSTESSHIGSVSPSRSSSQS